MCRGLGVALECGCLRVGIENQESQIANRKVGNIPGLSWTFSLPAGNIQSYGLGLKFADPSSNPQISTSTLLHLQTTETTPNKPITNRLPPPPRHNHSTHTPPTRNSRPQKIHNVPPRPLPLPPPRTPSPPPPHHPARPPPPAPARHLPVRHTPQGIDRSRVGSSGGTIPRLPARAAHLRGAGGAV